MIEVKNDGKEDCDNSNHKDDGVTDPVKHQKHPMEEARKELELLLNELAEEEVKDDQQ
jgi:hypothetical protein